MGIKKNLRDWYYNRDMSLSKTILLEANPDFADNTKYVYDELIRRGINRKYRIVWVVQNPDLFRDIRVKNVFFIKRSGDLVTRLRFLKEIYTAAFIIDCNRYIQKRNHGQVRIYLTHGCPIKVSREYGSQCGEVDYLLDLGHFFAQTYTSSFHVRLDQVIDFGFPRNDAFFKEEYRFKLFPELRRRKTIIWLPTFRNHRNQKSYEIDTCPFGIGSVSSADDLLRINEACERYDVALLIKMHPAEDLSKVSELNLSHVRMFHDDVFTDHHNLYEALACTDALITDYSSVYYDYLLADKPIALAVSDLEEFTSKVEVLFDDYQNNIIGEYCFNSDELISFIKNVSEGRDVMKKERNEALHRFHDYIDGNASKRIVDLLEKHMEG